MRQRAANETIITRAQQRGSAATTQAGAWRYLLAHLGHAHRGLAWTEGDRRYSAQHPGHTAEQREWSRLRVTRRADGRARVLGYAATNPEYAAYCEAYEINVQRDRYQADYLACALSIQEALARRVHSTWSGHTITINVGHGVTARVDWDVDSDWEYYPKAYGRPKNIYSNRRVDFWRWTPETGIERMLSIPVEAFRGHYLRRALIEGAQRLELPDLCEAVRNTPTERQRKETELITPKPCYKRVAIGEDGVLFSIYDGVTTYALGHVVQDTPRTCPDYDDICGYGGIFLHVTRERAESQKYPDSSAALALPRVTIRGEYWGRVNVNDKIAAEFFRPVEIVEEVTHA